MLIGLGVMPNPKVEACITSIHDVFSSVSTYLQTRISSQRDSRSSAVTWNTVIYLYYAFPKLRNKCRLSQNIEQMTDTVFLLYIMWARGRRFRPSTFIMNFDMSEQPTGYWTTTTLYNKRRTSQLLTRNEGRKHAKPDVFPWGDCSVHMRKTPLRCHPTC